MMTQPTFNLAEQCIMKPFTKDLKDWFTDENNKTGCRFMVVDAHNHPRTLHFYEQNGFKYLHKTEDEEREYYHIPMDEPIHTRLMYFDLKKI